MTVAGACGALLAVRGATPRAAWYQSPGLRVAGFLGLVCGSFNALQVVRDHDVDKRLGVRTSAVVFGWSATGWIFRLLVLLSAAYGYFIAHSYAALLMAAAAPLAVRPGSAARAWDITRIIGALAWVGVLVELFLNRL